MIYTLTMNPAIDKTAEVQEVQVGGLNRLENVMNDAGGKGINVSKTLQVLGKTSICLGVLAGNSGTFIQSELDSFQIKHDFLIIEGNTRTNLKVVDKNSVLSEFNESGPSPTIQEQNLLIQDILFKLDEKDILVVSGSVPAKVEKDFYYRLIKLAKEKGTSVILDADGDLFVEGVKAKPDIIKPNRYELSQYFKVNENMDDKMLIKYAHKWIEQGIKTVVVSMGSDGAYFITEDQIVKAEPLKVEVHSSVGAGDAMVAALAYALEENLSLEDISKLCSACGAGAVMTKGTKPASIQKIAELKELVILQK